MRSDLDMVYRRFGESWAHGTSPRYEEWAVGIADDPQVLAAIDALPPSKRQPNLVFAAARWAGSPLSPYSSWRRWLLEHWSKVEAVALARTVQTNEPNRCATLLPALSAIDGPLALLEVGAAAGLCLLPDRYAYRYRIVTGEVVVGAAETPMACRVAGALPEVRLPEVVWRRGIDLSPLDATDPETVRWLETLVWPGPDHDGRVARLRAAAAVAALDPPEIVPGDLLGRLEEVAAGSPPDATLVVFHSAVLMYLTPDERTRFVELVSGLGRRIRRKVVWLAQETSTVLELPLPPGLGTDGRFVQSVDGVPAALAGQHGATYERLP